MDAPDLREGLDLLKTAFDTFRLAIGLVKETAGTLPDEKKAIVDAALEKSERAAQLAEAQIAKALGYRLCQCTFPPQIMLSVGYRGHEEYFRCPKCSKEWPGPPVRGFESNYRDEIPSI